MKAKKTATKAKSATKATKPKQTTTQPDISDYNVMRNVDNTGIRITITCRGQPVHTFVLAATEYMHWRTLNQQAQAMFVSARTNSRIFGNNQQVINLVIQATVNMINQIIPRLQRQQALRTVLMK